jgi:hypothetical protein
MAVAIGAGTASGLKKVMTLIYTALRTLNNHCDVIIN